MSQTAMEPMSDMSRSRYSCSFWLPFRIWSSWILTATLFLGMSSLHPSVGIQAQWRGVALNHVTVKQKNIVIPTLQSLEYIPWYSSISPFTKWCLGEFPWYSQYIPMIFPWSSNSTSIWMNFIMTEAIFGFLEDSWMLIQTLGATIAWWAMWCWWTQIRMEIPRWWGWRPCLGDVPVMLQGLAQTLTETWLWKINDSWIEITIEAVAGASIHQSKKCVNS